MYNHVRSGIDQYRFARALGARDRKEGAMPVMSVDVRLHTLF